MFDILFTNATIITMDNGSVIKSGYCGVSDKKIVYVSSEAPTDMAKKTINCHGNIIMPALINCHTHNAMTLLRGYSDDCSLNTWLFDYIFPAEAKLTEKDVMSGFELGMLEMLSTGTGSFSDMYFFHDKTLELTVKSGMRAKLCNAVIALSDSYCFEKDRSVSELMNILNNNLGSDIVKPQAGIHCERTSPPWVWSKAVDLASKYNLDMHIHLSETQVDYESCINEHSETPAYRLDKYGVFNNGGIAAHCCYLSEDDMKLLASRNVSAVHNPSSNLKLASGIADVSAMKEAGMNVALGTDGVSSNNSLDMFKELKLAALLAKNIGKDPGSFSAYDALELATVNGAKAQGFSDTGMIRVGNSADLIMLSVDSPHCVPMHDAVSNVVYSMTGADCIMTMVCGNILYDNGEFTTLDKERIMFEAEKRAFELLRR